MTGGWGLGEKNQVSFFCSIFFKIFSIFFIFRRNHALKRSSEVSQLTHYATSLVLGREGSQFHADPSRKGHGAEVGCLPGARQRIGGNLPLLGRNADGRA